MEKLELWDFHWGNLHTDGVALRDGLYELQKGELEELGYPSLLEPMRCHYNP